MVAAVVYASKYGATAEIARRVAEGIGPDTQTYDLADGQPDLTGYDTVVLGSAIYGGSPLPAMTAYLANADLSHQRVALFVAGMETDPDKREEELRAAYPVNLRARAVATAFLGGRFQFKRMNFMERFIIRRTAGTKVDVDAIDGAALDQFVREVVADQVDGQ